MGSSWLLRSSAWDLVSKEAYIQWTWDASNEEEGIQDLEKQECWSGLLGNQW